MRITSNTAYELVPPCSKCSWKGGTRRRCSWTRRKSYSVDPKRGKEVVYTTLPSSLSSFVLGSGGFCCSLAVGQRSTITYFDRSGDLQ